MPSFIMRMVEELNCMNCSSHRASARNSRAIRSSRSSFTTRKTRSREKACVCTEELTPPAMVTLATPRRSQGLATMRKLLAISPSARNQSNGIEDTRSRQNHDFK